MLVMLVMMMRIRPEAMMMTMMMTMMRVMTTMTMMMMMMIRSTVPTPMMMMMLEQPAVTQDGSRDHETSGRNRGRTSRPRSLAAERRDPGHRKPLPI
jgi:hypothetical protein